MAAEQPVGVVNIVQPLLIPVPIFDPAINSFSGWVELFEEWCTTNNIPAEPDPVNNVVAQNQRRSLFQTANRPRAYEILRTDCLPDRPNTKTIPELITILRRK